ncbi:HIT-like domain-containing protein [Geopyxis carbonaria]|nr:HIT-like domain-containing protein [Geopyxis carbonaria]
MSIPEEDCLRNFVFERLLNQNTLAKSVNLLGNINSQQAIIIAEKTAFNVSTDILEAFSSKENLSEVSLLDKNDIYHWFLASQTSGALPLHAEAKITLIYPATETHIKKYSSQNFRVITETPQIYRDLVKPFIDTKTEVGRLNWVYNILEHKSESERIIIEDKDDREGFILLPDLSKWDRRTMASMYTMAIINRRDVTSIRDLKKKDVPWLRRMQKKILEGLCQKFPEIEEDQIKLYIHYQPSYYHFHIHAAATSHDGGSGQTIGKALLLANVISQLDSMSHEDAGFSDVELTYTLGEESELWQKVFQKKE